MQYNRSPPYFNHYTVRFMSCIYKQPTNALFDSSLLHSTAPTLFWRTRVNIRELLYACRVTLKTSKFFVIQWLKKDFKIQMIRLSRWFHHLYLNLYLQDSARRFSPATGNPNYAVPYPRTLNHNIKAGKCWYSQRQSQHRSHLTFSIDITLDSRLKHSHLQTEPAACAAICS
jgi:hypothetical protein